MEQSERDVLIDLLALRKGWNRSAFENMTDEELLAHEERLYE